MAEIRYIDAIRQALADELETDPRVALLGEDITLGGPFGATKGLVDTYGEWRIRNTPISEATVVGLAVGAGLAGLRPVVEIMFVDFITLAMDQLVNHGAKLRYMTGGVLSVPLTIRAQFGATGGFGAHHSQSLEAWICHLPGVKVCVACDPYDAKGLILAAAQDDNPVFVVLNKMSLAMKGEVPEGPYTVPLGKAKIVRPGTNYTIVTWGRMVHEAKAAAEKLKAFGIDAEVIDPRTLQPFDFQTVMQSVKKTHRVMIVHEAVRFGGFGGEIASQIQELAFDYLDAPVARIGAPFSPVPFSPALEKHYVPNADSIVAGVKAQLGL